MEIREKYTHVKGPNKKFAKITHREHFMAYGSKRSERGLIVTEYTFKRKAR